MRNKKSFRITALISVLMIVTALILAGCNSGNSTISTPETSSTTSTTDTTADRSENTSAAAAEEAVIMTESGDESDTAISAAEIYTGGLMNASDLFTERDLVQTPDLTEAVKYTVSDGEDIHITAEGVYVLSGKASDVTVYVEADDQAKVQIVLDGVTIENADFPCIYVKQADKVYVTTTAESTLSVTGSFTADGDTNTDAVIFSKDDLVLNGTAVLNISSTDNGVVSKDDLKITGGTYNITASSKAFEANDSIRIYDGVFSLKAGTDCFHAENDEDDTLGYIYICGGEFNLESGDDAVHGESVVQIDGGTFNISAGEGIEGTYIQINDGTINITSWDDGINAAQKSGSYRATLEINGGSITVAVTNGDTDCIDVNGDLYIKGGTVNVTGSSVFDCDGAVEFTGGTVIVNGSEVDTIPYSMGGGGMGNMGGFMGGGGMGRPRMG